MIKQILLFIKFCFTILIGTLLLSACGSKSNIHYLPITYIADNQINPDIYNKPSPLVVTVFQLKSLTNFKNSDFFSLYQKPKITLGDDYLSQEQIEIRPNQKMVSSLELLPETRYLAVIAAYRDIDKAQWNRVIKLNNRKKLQLVIKLDASNITLGFYKKGKNNLLTTEKRKNPCLSTTKSFGQKGCFYNRSIFSSKTAISKV